MIVSFFIDETKLAAPSRDHLRNLAELIACGDEYRNTENTDEVWIYTDNF
jgi:hypothetical protein